MIWATGVELHSNTVFRHLLWSGNLNCSILYKDGFYCRQLVLLTLETDYWNRCWLLESQIISAKLSRPQSIPAHMVCLITPKRKENISVYHIYSQQTLALSTANMGGLENTKKTFSEFFICFWWSIKNQYIFYWLLFTAIEISPLGMINVIFAFPLQIAANICHNEIRN